MNRSTLVSILVLCLLTGRPMAQTPAANARRSVVINNARIIVGPGKVIPDGYLYVLTEEVDGALLRIEPAP